MPYKRNINVTRIGQHELLERRYVLDAPVPQLWYDFESTEGNGAPAVEQVGPAINVGELEGFDAVIGDAQQGTSFDSTDSLFGNQALSVSVDGGARGGFSLDSHTTIAASGEPFTVVLFYKPPVLSGPEARLLNTGTVGLQTGWQMDIVQISADQMTLRTEAFDGSPVAGSATVSGLTNNGETTFMFSLVYDGNGFAELSVFEDGEFMAVGSSASYFFEPADGSLRLGQFLGGGATGGIYDDLAAFDRALTPDELDKIAFKGVAQSIADNDIESPQLWYDFEAVEGLGPAINAGTLGNVADGTSNASAKELNLDATENVRFGAESLQLIDNNSGISLDTGSDIASSEAQAFTVGLHVDPTALAAGGAGRLFRTAPTSLEDGWQVDFVDTFNNTMKLRAEAFGGDDLLEVEGITNTINDEIDFFVALAYDGAGSAELYAFADGTLIDKAGGRFGFGSTTQTLRMGEFFGGGALAGVYDDWAVWDQVLSEEDFAAIAQDGVAASLPSEGCDIDGNGVCDAADIDAMTQMVLDGDATDADRTALIESPPPEGFNTLMGDSNLDGEFNSSDLVAVFVAGKFETGSPAGWAEGDWNGDGFFNSSDFVAAFVAGGYEQGPRAAVAEPASLVLFVVDLPSLAGALAGDTDDDGDEDFTDFVSQYRNDWHPVTDGGGPSLEIRNALDAVLENWI